MTECVLVAFSENKSINTNPDVMKYKYLIDQTVQEVRDADLWKITVENGVNVTIYISPAM